MTSLPPRDSFRACRDRMPGHDSRISRQVDRTFRYAVFCTVAAIIVKVIVALILLWIGILALRHWGGLDVIGETKSVFSSPVEVEPKSTE
jgi:hypothetical protein